VAVVGSGPAGLTVAGELIKLGHRVTIFEALHKTGGVLVYGIPEFRLPKAVVKRECDFLGKLGVEYHMNMPIGPSITVPELLKTGYDAVFIGTGAGLPWFLNIPGENLKGVYSSNEFLTRINLMKAYRFPDYDTPVLIGRNVAVCGGGNVAMDCARSALRLGAENVYIIYRRTRKEMPARVEEVEHAVEEGVILRELTNPIRVIGDDKDWVKGLECLSMELGEPDASGRRRPVPKAGSEHVVEVDQFIVAVGQGPNPILTKKWPELGLDKHGHIPTDANQMTNIPGVFAGGDIVTGAATVIEAMGAGKRAAKAMDDYLKAKPKA
jgi:glutamate synthase (NADPH/NADH) small chain